MDFDSLAKQTGRRPLAISAEEDFSRVERVDHSPAGCLTSRFISEATGGVKAFPNDVERLVYEALVTTGMSWSRFDEREVGAVICEPTREGVRRATLNWGQYAAGRPGPATSRLSETIGDTFFPFFQG